MAPSMTPSDNKFRLWKGTECPRQSVVGPRQDGPVSNAQLVYFIGLG